MDAAPTPPGGAAPTGPGPGVWRRLGEEVNCGWEQYPLDLAQKIFASFCDGKTMEWIYFTSQGRKRKLYADDSDASTTATHRVDFETMKEVDLSTKVELEISIIQAAISINNYTPTEVPAETGIWWKNSLGKWQAYSRQAVEKILQAQRKGAKYLHLNMVTTKYPDGMEYTINLTKMVQQNPASFRQRPIRIIPNMILPLEVSSTCARKDSTISTLGSNLLLDGLQKLLTLKFLSSMVAKMVHVPHQLDTITLNEGIKDSEKALEGADTIYGRFWTAYETLVKNVPGCCGQLYRLLKGTSESDEESSWNQDALLRHVFFRAPLSEQENILKNGLQGDSYINEDFAVTTNYYRPQSLESPTHILLMFLVIVPRSFTPSASRSDAFPVVVVEHQLPIGVLTLTKPTGPEVGLSPHESGKSGGPYSIGLDCATREASQSGSCLQDQSSEFSGREKEITEPLTVPPLFLHPTVGETMLLVFRLYCPEKEKLRFVGGIVVMIGGRPTDILVELRQKAGFPEDAKILLYSEESAKRIDPDSTYEKNQLRDGSFVVFNSFLTEKEQDFLRCPDWLTFREQSFWEHTRNRQVLHLRQKSNPTVDEFFLEMSNQDTYSDVVQRVARHLDLQDEIRVRLTLNDCLLQQPRHLSLESGLYCTLLADAYNQTMSILYYENLKCSPRELDGCKNLTIDVYDGKGKKLGAHEIKLFKASSVRDAIQQLKGIRQVQAQMSNPAAEMRIFQVHCKKISRIHSPNERIGDLCTAAEGSSSSSRQQPRQVKKREAPPDEFRLRAVEIPPEENKEMDPQDLLIQVRHYFHQSTDLGNFDFSAGEPFLIVVREHEALSHIIEQISGMVQITDKELAKCKFALFSDHHREYIQENDLVASRMKKFSRGRYRTEFYWLGVDSTSIRKQCEGAERSKSSKRLLHPDGTDSTNLLAIRPTGIPIKLESCNQRILGPMSQDFDLQHIREGQVWSMYDTHGVPRLYGLINRIRSDPPFQLELSRLELHEETELVNPTGVSITCGEYKIRKDSVFGNEESIRTLFSSLMLVAKSLDSGVVEEPVKLYPRRGEVWAIFRDWNVSKDAPNPISREDLTNYNYDFMWILNDYPPEVRLEAKRLVSIALKGSTTVFRQQIVCKITYRRGDLRKFSHRVMSAEETQNNQDGILPGQFQFDNRSLYGNNH